MNMIELMMMEHASLRVHLRLIREKNSDSLYEVEDFVRNCHARIEDEVIFPKLKELLTGRSDDLVKALSRLEADHRLIEKIGDEIKLRTVQGDLEVLRKRVMLYAATLESHNNSEETLIFPSWPPGPADQGEASKAKEIIEEYGLDRYFKVTGVSEKLLESVTQFDVLYRKKGNS